MIAKIVKGQGFRGIISYVLDAKKGTEILDSSGIRLKDQDSIIRSFTSQAEMNIRLSKPVGHISLDFSVQDKDKLTNELMVRIAKDYMDRMEIRDTQYLIGRHFDKEHPHIHLVFNRVDNNGKTISDKNDRFRSEKICKELTFKFRLYFATGKEKVKENRLKEPDKTRYEIYHSLKELIPNCHNWQQLIDALNTQGIRVSFKLKGKSDQVQGIIFAKNGYLFNGSKVDRQFSFSKICMQLQTNRSKHLPDHIDKNRGLSSIRRTENILTGALLQWQKQTGYQEKHDKKAAILRKEKKKGFRR